MIVKGYVRVELLFMRRVAMRQKVIAGALILAPLLFPVSATAETVFWLDTPEDGATVFGLVEVKGFVVDDGSECGPQWTWNQCRWDTALVTAIDLYVDGDFVATADLNQPRYDVLLAYPWYAGTPYERPGFSTSFDSRDLNNGIHTLYLKVTYSDMAVDNLGERSFNVDNEFNQAPFGELELPGPNQPMNGVFPITGWALDDGSVATIEVLVDGLAVGDAVSGIHRPDIGHRFPSHPDAEAAGSVRMLNTTVFQNGVHSVAIRLTDDEGASRIIGRRFVQTFNTGYNLPPFGGIDWPISNHILYGKGCVAPGDPPISTPPIEFEDPEFVEFVTGWALDVGSRTDAGGVAYVQLLIDGVIVADTMENSVYWPLLDMDMNYYGHPRMDILEWFVDVPNAKQAGFSFLIDPSYLMVTQGFTQGLHYLKVRAGDIENYVADIAQIPVIFDCDDDRDRPGWGDIYTPAHMERVAGVVEVTGWAIDQDGTSSSYYPEIWVDGVFIDYADEYFLPSPEVEEGWPWLPSGLTRNAGFSYDLDTEAEGLGDGPHVLVVWSVDRFGRRSIIGERTFVLDNASP
jgi:hypothetical protein